MMRLLALCILISQVVHSQDITGLWAGSLSTNGNVLPYELVISQDQQGWSGYSLTIFNIDGQENAGLKSMKIKQKNGKLTIEDDELIDNSYTVKPRRMMLWASLTVSGKDTLLMLSGNFNARGYGNDSFKGTVVLKKQSIFKANRILKELEQKGLTNSLSFIKKQKQPETINLSSTTAKKDPEPKKGNQFAENKPEIPTISSKPLPTVDITKRKIETLQTIDFRSDSIVLSLYDNGQVDGDTVTVLLNGQPIISKKGLTTNAIKHVIKPGDGIADSMQLIMYAENLGSIPPNTGLLVIEEGGRRHEVRFSGDLERNTAIILRRRR